MLARGSVPPWGVCTATGILPRCWVECPGRSPTTSGSGSGKETGGMGDRGETFRLRLRRRARLLGAAAGAGALLTAGCLLSPAGALPRFEAHHAALGVLQPVAGETVPLHGGSTSSLNWSGYAVTGSNITGV